MSRKVDMHLHSYASDGEWSPEQVIENIDKNNIKIFSVTDHDEIGCVAQVAELVKERLDLTYIKGVEGTVIYKGMEHHILTYYIDETDVALLKLIDYNRKVRNDYNSYMIEFLRENYPELSVEGYNAYDYNPYQGGWRAYGYLQANGVIHCLEDYFSVIKGFNYEKKFLTPEAYIPKMAELGYKTVLAHPPAYTEGDIYEVEALDYLRNLGLHGIECYTKYLKDQQNSQYYVDYCNRHQMMITGGSDCHGGFVGRRIGHPNVDESMIRLV